MIGMMVELTVARGSTDVFERAFAVQAASVRANEPGNRLYELFKSSTLTDSYTLSRHTGHRRTWRQIDR